MSFAAENISVTYRGRVRRKAVTDVSFSVDAGEWLAIVGPNGAGKSTLLKAAAGLLPSDGLFLCDGTTVASKPEQRAKQLAYLPQRLSLPHAMVVFDYVMLGRTAHIAWLGRQTATDKQIATEMLALVDASSFAQRLVTELSGGELQRVALARALCQQSSVLLLDEPASALDIGQQSEILELLARLKIEQELTIISVLHDLTQAGRYCDSLLIMQQGQSVGYGDATMVLRQDSLQKVYSSHVRVIHDDSYGLIIVPDAC